MKRSARKKQVIDQVKTFKKDILGIYCFSGREAPRIELYWMAHALFASAFGVRIEDLALVTLTHELAHAYTHLGRDIDGNV